MAARGTGSGGDAGPAACGAAIRRPAAGGGFRNLWQRSEGRGLVLPLGICAVLILVGQIVRPGFGSLQNIGNLLALASILALGAAGQTLVIVCGDYGIDLTLGALMSMGAVLGSGVLQGSDAHIPLTLVVLAGAGALFGLCNGLAVWYLKIPSLVMTLAMGSVVNGFTLAVSQGRPFGWPRRWCS